MNDEGLRGCQSPWKALDDFRRLAADGRDSAREGRAGDERWVDRPRISDGYDSPPNDRIHSLREGLSGCDRRATDRHISLVRFRDTTLQERSINISRTILRVIRVMDAKA